MLKQFSLLFSPTLVGEYNVNKEGEILFSRVCGDRTRGNGFKLKEERLRLDIRKMFFTIRVARHWHRLPTEMLDIPSLETLKVSGWTGS